VLKHEIAQHHDEMRAHARDAHRRIVEDDNGFPRFARVTQNIAVEAALLRGLLEPATPEGCQAQHDIRMLLKRTVV
jgi:hypothetical protein